MQRAAIGQVPLILGLRIGAVTGEQPAFQSR